MWKSLLTIPFLLALAACGSSGSGNSSATTYSISGTLDAGATASSASIPMRDLNIAGLDFSLKSRTACTDGKFYSVFCMTFQSPPTAAEGDVDCSGGGGFTVAGLPLNEPIYCVVRRYESAAATSGSSIGAIEIPSATLSGSTDTIVGAGDLSMNVTIGSSGSISATVSGKQGDSSNSTADSFFTPTNANGIWELVCDNNNGGSQFSAGACKCFLGEAYYGPAGYSNQDDCMNDSNGAGAAITQTVALGIDMHVYNVTANADIPMDSGQTIPSGTALKAISIWGTTGAPNYVTTKAGGEGITDLGGKLTWATTPENPTTDITWSTATVTVKDGSSSSISVTIPAMATTSDAMTHAQWITWLQGVASSAESGGFNCTWGPSDSNGYADNNLHQNIECINQVMEALSEQSVGALVPRIRIHPFCDQSGCYVSIDGTDSAKNYYDTGALTMARLEFEDWDLNYPSSWAKTDDNSSVAHTNGGIGVSPRPRYVFEPLMIHPNGAGFRQGNSNERHYHCVPSSPGSEEVANSACLNDGNYYELACWYKEELSIKFIGSSSPMDAIFESTNSLVSARLIKHSSTKTEISPSGTTVIDMCNSKLSNGGNFTFFATATKK